MDEFGDHREEKLGDAYMLVAGPRNQFPWQPLLDLPESLPGAQLVRVEVTNHQDPEEIPDGVYFVFNCEFFLPAPTADKGFEKTDFTAATSYQAFVNQYHVRHRTKIGRVAFVTFPAAPRITLVTRTRTTAGECFWRVSAYASDRRVTMSRELVKDTYVTTDSDIGFVSSGLGAVGRYALPNPFPAVYVFAVRPEAGTRIELGTVRPSYGQAGGGVEGVFKDDTAPWSVSNHVRVLPAW